MNKIALIHFYPPELYPPLQNLIMEISRKQGSSLILLTNHAVNENLSVFKVDSSSIKIIRITKIRTDQKPWIRYANYVLFYFASIWKLLLFAPRSILYFETISSFPALVYHFFFRKVKLFIHYHEYTSNEEYQSGMLLNRLFHQWEKKIYKRAEWLSHTNNHRMHMFIKDISYKNLSNTFILPNYPSKEWKSKPKPSFNDPLMVVYAGAFSLDTMYTQEFAHWVADQKGAVVWDIYSYNLSAQARDFISVLNCPWINLRPGVDYEKLPQIIKNYNVGIILYNGHIPNYIYNAPNKLFEYLACGLDVWFPHVMAGAMDFVTNQTFPRVTPIHLDKLVELDVRKMLDRSGYICKESDFYYEVALEPLVQRMA